MAACLYNHLFIQSNILEHIGFFSFNINLLCLWSMMFYAKDYVN